VSFRIVRLRGAELRRRLPEILELHAQVLGPLSQGRFCARLRGRRRVLVLAALVQDRLVGYKVGFEERPGLFYSWVGGVHPDHRRQGIARALMQEQHRLVRQAGYRQVRTVSKNKHKAMLVLNIRSGFNIIGTYLDGRGELKIVFQKSLKPPRGPSRQGSSPKAAPGARPNPP
jgi:predicted GNAT superfamily acetyltransferase